MSSEMLSSKNHSMQLRKRTPSTNVYGVKSLTSDFVYGSIQTNVPNYSEQDQDQEQEQEPDQKQDHKPYSYSEYTMPPEYPDLFAEVYEMFMEEVHEESKKKQLFKEYIYGSDSRQDYGQDSGPTVKWTKMKNTVDEIIQINENNVDKNMWNRIFRMANVNALLKPYVVKHGAHKYSNDVQEYYPKQTFQQYVDSIININTIGAYDLQNFVRNMSDKGFRKNMMKRHENYEHEKQTKNTIIHHIFQINQYIKKNKISMVPMGSTSPTEESDNKSKRMKTRSSKHL
jgi:hypothetical protein